MDYLLLACASVAVVVLVGCGDDTTGDGGTGGAAGSPATGGSGSGGGSASGCGAKVTIAFFSDAACTAQVGQRMYDTGLECFSWTAMGSNAEDNSATRFQCYADRICYT